MALLRPVLLPRLGFFALFGRSAQNEIKAGRPQLCGRILQACLDRHLDRAIDFSDERGKRFGCFLHDGTEAEAPAGTRVKGTLGFRKGWIFVNFREFPA